MATTGVKVVASGVGAILGLVSVVVVMGMEGPTTPDPWTSGWRSLMLPLGLLIAGSTLFGITSYPFDRGGRREICRAVAVSFASMAIGLGLIGWTVLNSPFSYTCSQGPCYPTIPADQNHFAHAIWIAGGVTAATAVILMFSLAFTRTGRARDPARMV